MKVLTLFVGILIVHCAFAGSSSSSSSSSEESGSKKKGSSSSSSAGGDVEEAEAKQSENSSQSQKVTKETVTAVAKEPSVVLEKRPSKTTILEEPTPGVIFRGPRVVEYIIEGGYPYSGYPTIPRALPVPYQGLPAYQQLYGPSYLRSQLSYRQPSIELQQAGLVPPQPYSPLYRHPFTYLPAAPYPSLPIGVRSLPYSSLLSSGPVGYPPTAVSVGYPQNIVPQTVTSSPLPSVGVSGARATLPYPSLCSRLLSPSVLRPLPGPQPCFF